MELINFGEYYYPPKELKQNLEKLIIFSENQTKKNIPNGSFFVYDSLEYDPQILKSDVGCGISSFITEDIDFTDKNIDDILKAVNELGIHIGQGNHFIDFTIGHPNLHGNMIYLHSDFNNENIVPQNYDQAKILEKRAYDLRLDYLEKLTKTLGINSEFYKDWTHNSVEIKDNLMIYRKGTIDLKKSDQIGVLALNPLDGVFLYCGNFEDYEYCAQHGTGRIGSKSELLSSLVKKKKGIARGYLINKTNINSDIQSIKSKTYNSMDNFRTNFFKEYFVLQN